MLPGAASQSTQPDLLYVGLTYRHGGLAIREQLARRVCETPALLHGLRDLASECAILKTCGRFEIYAGPGAAETEAFVARLAAWTDTSPDQLCASCIRLDGLDVVQHLLEVAAGLNSRILGEDQVLHQVREAYRIAQQAGMAGAMLSTLFQTAIHHGREVRREAGFEPAVRSFAALAVQQLLPPQLSRGVIVIGTGTMARETLVHLRARGCRHAVVVSRHVDRATQLSRRFGWTARPLQDLAELMNDCGALLSCTHAARYVVRPAMLTSLPGTLRIIDLGMPRTVDPAVARIPGARLSHIDDIPACKHLSSQAQARAQATVADGLQRFRNWCAGRRVAREIVGLLEQARRLPPTEARRLRPALHARVIQLKESAA